jgi:hypothetical protein
MRYASRFLLFWVDKGGDGPDHCLEKGIQGK